MVQENIKMCSMCGSLMKLIPAGVSKKTGKSYNSFWSCQNPNCKHTESLMGESKQMREPNWSPKIIKAEENAKIDQILGGIKTIHHNILCLNKKINDIITKSGNIPVVDEIEEEEDILDQDDLRNI